MIYIIKTIIVGIIICGATGLIMYIFSKKEDL